MSSNRKNKKRRHGYHHVNVPGQNRIRVRSKRLDQADEDKIALAFWLLAKQLVEDESDDATTNPDVDTDSVSEEAA